MPNHMDHVDNPLAVLQCITTPDHLHSWFQRFYDNLHFLETWKPYELLMLIQQGVDISHVTHDWLIQFREDLDLKV